MAAELRYASDPNHKPAAPAAATTHGVSWATVAILVFLALNLALCVRRLRDGDRGGAAFLGVSYLNLALVVYAPRRFELAPQGSPAHGRAKFAVWLLTTTLTASFIWKIGEVMPLGLAVAAAATVGGWFYVLFLHDDEKPSAESMTMRDCERDGRDLWVPAS